MRIDEVKAAARAWLESGKWRWEPGMKSLGGARVLDVSVDPQPSLPEVAFATARAGMLGGQLTNAAFYRDDWTTIGTPDINDRATALLLWAQSRGEA